EAMKMENEIKAPASGIIKTIHVKVGEILEKGVIMMELE
ncbi:MAG: acetyl-CoA carboxylase biotin carboxyl carrier protein subunit, partial [Bdellovibrionales bacterium]|nr:acetyl-CoA carboxylase biotin carboxyl carrier protein subunit [Bdellovibrionales bacterium]